MSSCAENPAWHPTTCSALQGLLQEPYLALSLVSLPLGISACALAIVFNAGLAAAGGSPDGVLPKPVLYLTFLVAFAALSGALGAIDTSVGRRKPAKLAVAIAFVISTVVSIFAGGWLALLGGVTIRLWFVALSMMGFVALLGTTAVIVLASLQRRTAAAAKETETVCRVVAAVWGLGGLLLALRALWSWFVTAVDSLPLYGYPSWGVTTHHELLQSAVAMALGALAILVAARCMSRCVRPGVQLSGAAGFYVACGLVLADAPRWGVDHWSSDVVRLAPGRTLVMLLLLASVVTGLASTCGGGSEDRWATIGGGLLIVGSIVHGWYTDFGQPLVDLRGPRSGFSTMAYPMALGLGVLSLALWQRTRAGGSTHRTWPTFAFQLGSVALVVGVYLGGLGVNWRGNAVAGVGALVVTASSVALLRWLRFGRGARSATLDTYA